mgnify:CR=1 FL=1
MLFEVTRTSSWDYDNPPYDGCIPIKITRVETRTLGSAEEFDARFSKTEGKWFSVGSNHRFNNKGYITRDREEVDSWGIEINTLEELMELKNRVGEELYVCYFC